TSLSTSSFLSLSRRRPQRPPLFPYTTLFRSARAVLMREARGPAWTDWLHERGVVALSGIDTRSLVLKLREAGALRGVVVSGDGRSDEHTSELQSPCNLVCRLLLEKKKKK